MLQSKQEKEKRCMGLLDIYMQVKGYVRYYRLHRELERIMGVVEFHFLDKENVKQEALTFRSYNDMIETLTEKIKQSDGKPYQREFFIDYDV
ncbi:hypothetical protein KVM50_02995 [Helicobacter pylori]|nr:hypothetical protein KVM50_02995 [Helicobacter pylori]